MDGATATVDGESFLFTGFKSTFEESPSLGFPTPTPTTPSSFRSRSSSSGSSSPVPLAVPHMSTYPLSYAAPYSGSTPTVASVASSRTSISTNRSMTPTRELTSPGSRTVMMPMKGGTKTRVSMRTTSPTGSISSMGGSANGLNMTYNSKQSFDGEVKTPTVDRYYHNTSPTSPTGSQLPYVSSMRNSPPAGKVVAGDGYYTPSHSQSPSISSMASSKSSARSTTPTLQNATMSSSTLSHRTMSSTTSASSNSHGPTPHSHDKRPKTDFEPAFDPRRAMARSKSHDLLNAAHGLTNPPPSDMYRPASSIAYSNGTDHQYFHHSHRPTPSGSSVAPLPNATATRPESGYSDGSEDDGSANATPRGSVAFGFGQSNRNSVASVLDLMNGGRGKDEEEESSTRVDFFAPKLNLELDFGGLSLGWDDDKNDNKGLMTPKAKEGGPIGPTSTSIQPNESSSVLKRGTSVKRRPTVKATGSSIGHTSTPSTASTVSTFLGTGEKGKGSARPSDPTEYRSTRSRGYSSGASSLLDLKLPSESRDDDLWSLDLFDNKKSANGTVKVKSPTSRIPVPKIPEGVYDNPSASLSHSRSSSETPKSSLSHETSANFAVDQMTNRPPAEAERPDSRASLRSAFMIKTTSATSAETATMSRNGHKPLDRSRTPSLSSLLSLSRLTKQDPASSMMNGNGNGSPATVDTRSINSSNSSLSPSRSTEGTATTKTNFFSKISSNALTKRRKSGTSMISISDSYTGDDASGSSRDAHPSDKSTFSRQNLKASIKKFTLEPPTPLNLVRPKSPGAGLSLNKSLPPTPTPIHDQGDREDEDKGKERGGLKRGLSRMRKKSENVLGGLKNAAVAAAAAAANATNSNQPEAMPPRPKTPDHLSQFPMGKKAFSKSSTNLESGVAAEDKERPPLREIKTSAASVVSSIGKAGSKAVKAVRKNSFGLERQMRESQQERSIATNRRPSLASSATSSDGSDPGRTSLDDEGATVFVAARVDRVTPSPVPSIAPLSAVRASVSPVLIQRERAITTNSIRSSGSGSDVTPAQVLDRKKRTRTADSGLGSDGSMSSAWLDIEEAMSNFAKQGSNERGSVVSNSLLPFIKKEELRLNYRPDERLAKRQREILFGWLDMLHQELQQVQPSHRGACLEAAAGILECRYLSAATMNEDEMGEERFKTIIVRLIAWAIDKLNDKAVYANTLVFAGRLFALAFFRIDGVALKLLRALPPVKRGSLRRILGEAGLDETDLPPVEPELFPRHLWRNNPDPEDDGYLIRHEDIVVEMNGNWLLRWTASDSDLPFAFLRAYHRQLARYLYPDDVFHDKMDVDHPSEYIGAPGFLFLAASLMDKVDALIRRNLRSVTSISPSNNVNATESANLTMGQKPKVLELANRRLVSTILDIIGGQPTNEETEEEDKNTDPRNRHRLFGGMLKVWIKAVVKRTSLWDTRGVFLLLDWIEGLIYTICFVPLPKGVDPPPPQVPVPESVELFDILFILSFIKTILMEADNTVCLMRTIAFLYAHFEVLTLRKQDREELCEKMLLDRALFQRLFLSFNVGVRGYFQRLMVWRLSRIGVAAGDNIQQQRDPQVLKIFAIFNMRLEAVRRRHDEIDPIPDLPEDGLDDPFRPKRSTICSTRGVKEVDWVVDELEIPDVEVTVDEEELPPAPLDLIPIKPKREKEKKAVNMAAVVSWLKILNPRKGGTKRGDDPHAPIDPFTIDGPPAYAESDKFMDVTQNPEPSSFELPQLPSIPRTSSSSLAPSTSRRTKRSVSPDIPVPPSPTFFSFEFEVDAPRSDNFDPARSASALGMDPDIAVNPTPFPVVGSSTRRQSDIPKPSSPNHPISPRVSLRFSKRVSILPPPALNFFTEGGQPVPPIPDAFKAEEGYDKRLHQYAIRSLREYEEALDEFDMHYLWRAEEESSGKKADNTVPRLAVSWPNVFDDS